MSSSAAGMELGSTERKPRRAPFHPGQCNVGFGNHPDMSFLGRRKVEVIRSLVLGDESSSVIPWHA